MKKDIYIIKNKINDKVYIGQSVDAKRRFVSHKSRANLLVDEDNSALHKAMKKYGVENFYFEILEEQVSNYNEREIFWIKYYNSQAPNGYNLTEGGENPPIFCGEEHFANTVSDEELMNIIKDLQEGILTQKEIEIKYGKTQPVISAINIGYTHRLPNIKYPIRKESPYHISHKEIPDIIWLIKNTKVPFKDIAEYFNVSTSSIKAINAGRNHFIETETYPLRTERGKKQEKPVETILAERSKATQ